MSETTINDAPTIRDEAAGNAGRLRSGDEILGRYVVESELGQGGMGVVYKCLDRVGRVEVAVKGLPPEVSHNADEMEEIRDNYSLVEGLRHPNICGIKTLEKDDRGDYYLVMDLARGVNLNRWLKKHPDTTDAEKLAILKQIASALDYAHEMKIIHRDVKPENVMVADDGTVQVLDFGLAAQIRSSLSRTSRAVISTSGTPGYKAPEQWRGQPQGSSADQYALGVLAYRLFAGRLPFEGDDLVILGQAVLNEPVPKIPVASPVVNAALGKALAKRPEVRFVSCGTFVDALDGKASVESKRPFGKFVMIAALLALMTGGGLIYKHEVDVRNAAAEKVAKAAAEKNAAEEKAAKAAAEKKAAEEKAVKAAAEKKATEEKAVKAAAEKKAAEEKTAETKAFELASKVDSEHDLIEKFPEEVRSFFDSEIRSFENDRRVGNEAKDQSKNIVATNLLMKALEEAKGLRTLVQDRASCLDVVQKARNAQMSADEVKAETAFVQRYDEAKGMLQAAEDASKTRNFAVAATNAVKAAEQFVLLRANVIKTTIDEAKRYRDAARWQDCLESAEKVLGWETENAEARALKVESESNLVPSLKLVVQVEGREVECAQVTIDGMTYTSPVELKKLEKGSRLASISASYEAGGKRYRQMFSAIEVDWTGLKTLRLTLSEIKKTDLNEVEQQRRRLYPEYYAAKKTETSEMERAKIEAMRAEREVKKSAESTLRREGAFAGEVIEHTLPGGAQIKFVWCPPGTFTMGSPAGTKGWFWEMNSGEDGREVDEIQHRVTLTKGFWLGQFEVTQAQWESVMGGNPSEFKGDGTRPVENVSWDDCQQFISKCNASVFEITFTFPTEAQWEYACRAGSAGPYAGMDTLDVMGWYEGNSGGTTHPVGGKWRNAWNLYDMLGNVWEWCADWYGSYGGDCIDPLGVSVGDSRVIRGGGWGNLARYCRSAGRSRRQPSDRGGSLGFRLCCITGLNK